MIRALLAALVLSVGWATGAAACPQADGAGARVEGEKGAIALRLEPEVPRVDSFFAIDVTVCDTSGGAARLRQVDAVRPGHGHGMNYRPEIAERGDGRYRVEGMFFHMQGGWLLRFDVETPEGGERLTYGIDAGF